MKTIRFTRDLIATGIEPQALVAQLLSLITDIISNSAVSLPGSSTLAGPSDKTLLGSRFQISKFKFTINKQYFQGLTFFFVLDKFQVGQ